MIAHLNKAHLEEGRNEIWLKEYLVKKKKQPSSILVREGCLVFMLCTATLFLSVLSQDYELCLTSSWSQNDLA